MAKFLRFAGEGNSPLTVYRVRFRRFAQSGICPAHKILNEQDAQTHSDREEVQ